MSHLNLRLLTVSVLVAGHRHSVLRERQLNVSLHNNCNDDKLERIDCEKTSNALGVLVG